MAHSVIQSHSYQHFEDLRLSANDFYTMLEAMLKSYQYPDTAILRETLKEGGVFSSRREYLRIAKGNSSYYVCACPYGKSFFISWWLKDQEDALQAAAGKVPILGLLTGSNRKKTFYELDSELMFASCINSIIKIAINKVLVDHGYRKPQLEALDSLQ